MSRSRRHTPIGPFFCCNSNHISEKLEKRWRNRMIRAAARNALVRALRLNECLEDVDMLSRSLGVSLSSTARRRKANIGIALPIHQKVQRSELNLCESKKQSSSFAMQTSC